MENWETDNKPICIAFSGGRSSAVMVKKMLERFPERNIKVAFLNTGLEHEETYKFVDKCDKEWKLGVHWLESIPGKMGEGCDFKLVDFHSARRNGEPFEEVIQKYGIPNKGAPLCKDRLKNKPMKRFIKWLGWKDYHLAIGIRGDEVDRLSDRPDTIYPLADWGWTKEMVNAFMRQQPFDLELPSDIYSNCVGCWQMSFRKLATLAQKAPEYFDWWQRMEDKYKYHRNDCEAATNENGERLFYRNNTSVQEIFDILKDPNFKPYEDSGQLSIWDKLQEFDDYDKAGACDSGCSFV